MVVETSHPFSFETSRALLPPSYYVSLRPLEDIKLEGVYASVSSGAIP